MSNNEELFELKKISKILALSNAEILETELSKIATTNERKLMWILINGNRLATQIAQSVGVTAMAVSIFLNQLEAAGLIDYTRHQPPRKLIDFVPSSWLSLLD